MKEDILSWGTLLEDFPSITPEHWQEQAEKIFIKSGQSLFRQDIGKKTAISPLYWECPSGEQNVFLPQIPSLPFLLFQRLESRTPTLVAQYAREVLDLGGQGLVMGPLMAGNTQDCFDILCAEILGKYPVSMRIDPLSWHPIPSQDSAFHETCANLFFENNLALHAKTQLFMHFSENLWKTAQQKLPQTRFFLADTRLLSPSSTPAEMLADVLLQLVTHLRIFSENGHSPVELLKKTSLLLKAEKNLFSSLSTFRAMHLLWHKVCNVFGCLGLPCDLHVETDFFMMTKDNPHTNILRATAAAWASLLGGARAITVLPFTFNSSADDPNAFRLARNTVLVLQKEGSLISQQDPAAGSYAFEALTQDIAQKSWDLFQKRL